MTTPWRKAVRDFWLERARTVSVVLAIAMGIAGFAAVMSSYAILTRELDRGYMATNPASATLRTDAVDDDLVTAILATGEVSAAEARRTITGRIKAGPAEWRSLILFVVRDFGNIRVSTLQPQKGAWPPAIGEILIERDALQVARARIGDTVTVKTSAGTERTLRLTGSVKDVGQAQARMENIVYGYVTLDTLALLGEQPYLDQLKILVATNRFDEAHVQSVAANVKSLVESRGHPVRRMDVPPPGKHPHSDIMGLLLLAMAGFGLFVLLLSGILVVNLLTALMASQIRQIGMMQAVGGSRFQIARIYLGQALFLGAAAIVLALPIGLVGSRVLCRYLAVFLNFDINSFAVPAWVYLLIAAVGVVIPILSAAYPVWKGSGIPVRQALADYGVSRNAFGTSSFDRALAGISGLARPLLLAMRNSFRRRTRLALTVLTLTLGGLFFTTALNFRASLIHTLDRLFGARKYDLTVSLGSMYPLEKIERAARNTPGVLRAEGWIGTEGAIPKQAEAAPATGGGGSPHGGGAAGMHGGGAPAGDRFSVVALPTDTGLLKPEIVAGRWLSTGDTDAIVVNNALAIKGRMKAGDRVVLRVGPSQMTWHVVGVAREPYSPPVAYISKTYLEGLGGHGAIANNVRLALQSTDRATIDRVKAALDVNLEREQVRALNVTSSSDSRFGFDQHMVMIYVFLVIMSGIIGAVGGLGLMTTMSLNVLERRREMGVLRAIGASPAVVWLIVVSEGVVIGGLSWAIAVLAAWPVSKMLGDFLMTTMFKSTVDFLFDPRGPLVWLVFSIFFSVAASLLPAWHASRSSIREAVGYE